MPTHVPFDTERGNCNCNLICFFENFSSENGENSQLKKENNRLTMIIPSEITSWIGPPPFNPFIMSYLLYWEFFRLEA